jgi:hypothetical protein
MIFLREMVASGRDLSVALRRDALADQQSLEG